MSSWQQEFDVRSRDFRQVKHDRELVYGKKYLIKWRIEGDPNDHHIATFFGIHDINKLVFELLYTRVGRVEKELPYNIWRSARTWKRPIPLLGFPPSVFDDSVILKYKKPEVFDLGTFEGEISEPPPAPLLPRYSYQLPTVSKTEEEKIAEAKKRAIVPPPPPNSPRRRSEEEEEDYLDQGNPNGYKFSGGKRKSKKSKKNRRTSKKNRRTSKKGTKRSYKK